MNPADGLACCPFKGSGYVAVYSIFIVAPIIVCVGLAFGPCFVKWFWRPFSFCRWLFCFNCTLAAVWLSLFCVSFSECCGLVFFKLLSDYDHVAFFIKAL